MRRVLVMLICGFAALIAADASAAGRRVALVIGNGAYQSVAQLPNPPNDAADLSATLARLGFEVTTRLNLDYAATRRALQDFSDAAQGAEMALVFYAGHGIEVAGQNYVIPTDATLESDRSIAFEAIPLDLLLSTVNGASLLKVVLLDACRNNPFAARMQRSGGSRSVGRGLSRIEPATGTLVGFAAKGGTTAADGSGRNSPYTTALLRNLETPGLELSLMFRRVRDDVLTGTGQRQEPFTYGSLPGRNIYFVEPASGGGDAPRPQTGGEDRQTWESISGTQSVAMLKTFVRRYPDSLYADFARARIAELDAAPPPPSNNRATTAAGDWFVLLGAFPHDARGPAKDRRAALAARGLDARIVNTNDHANLRDGLFALALGPFTRPDAQVALADAKRIVPDAYMKKAR